MVNGLCCCMCTNTHISVTSYCSYYGERKQLVPCCIPQCHGKLYFSFIIMLGLSLSLIFV